MSDKDAQSPQPPVEEQQPVTEDQDETPGQEETQAAAEVQEGQNNEEAVNGEAEGETQAEEETQQETEEQGVTEETVETQEPVENKETEEVQDAAEGEQENPTEVVGEQDSEEKAAEEAVQTEETGGDQEAGEADASVETTEGQQDEEREGSVKAEEGEEEAKAPSEKNEEKAEDQAEQEEPTVAGAAEEAQVAGADEVIEHEEAVAEAEKVATPAGSEKAGTPTGSVKAGTPAGSVKAGTPVGSVKADSPAPAEPEKAATPAGSEKAATPAGSEKAASPTGSVKAASPVGSEKAASPAGSEKAVSPAGSVKAASPAGSVKAASPAGSEKAASPAGSVKAASPAGSVKAASPAGSVKAASPAGSVKAASPAPADLEKPTTPPPATEDVGMGTEPMQDMPEVDPHAESPRREDSPRTKINLEATATVKFVLMPSGQVATLACTLGQTLQQLKEHFASELKMSANLLLIMLEGRNISNDTKLADLGVGPNGTIQLELSSVDPVNSPLKQYRPRQEYHMPDVISVKILGNDGEYRDAVVEIERAMKKKPFLGGYRHKKTNVEYHHASAQTMAKPRPPSNVEKNCRDTQTVQQRHRFQQTTSDMSTQMTKIGVYVSNMEDKLMVPGKYISADDRKAEELAKIITIQKYYRRWLAIRNVAKIRDDRDRRLEWEKQEELRKRKEKEDRIKKEFERRMNPKTKEDFDLLYHALEKWRQEELDNIDSTLTGAERKAALCQLLEQETQLIGSIGRHKLEADTENKQKSIQAFLDKAASPKRWRGHDGKVTEMDTPYTIRAQELRDIYATTNMRYLTQDERLDVLLTLKHTVKEHDCKLTQEIIELIDREADLLMRGVKESNLEGLRKRISTLFLQYIKTPMFNPEVTKLLKVPQDPSVLRKNIYYCTSCNQYLPSTDFQLSSNARSVGRCTKCSKKDNDGRIRQDYSHYRYMLKALRKSEESYDDGSNIAFLLQESDLRYLVENVWSSQSVLSAWDDLYDLVLVRWDRNEEWSPWNCILLTKEEASAHQKLENLEEGYGKIFIHKVDHKHTLAKNYFSRLAGMAQLMQTKEPKNPNSRMPTISGKKLSVHASA